MNANELATARDEAHVFNAAEISYADWKEIAIKLLAHIDLQAGQIATLKAALIDHIAQDKIAQMGRFGFVLDPDVCDPYGDAKKQLTAQYPEIFQEEKECISSR